MIHTGKRKGPSIAVGSAKKSRPTPSKKRGSNIREETSKRRRLNPSEKSLQSGAFKAIYQIRHKSTPEFEERLANLRRGNPNDYHSLFSQEEIKISINGCRKIFIEPSHVVIVEPLREGLSEDELEKRLMALKADPLLENLERRLKALNAETSVEQLQTPVEQLQRRFEALKRPSMEQLQERLAILKAGPSAEQREVVRRCRMLRRADKIPAHDRPPTKPYRE